MKVPGFELARVPQAKIIDYLLSATHREGAGKAAFFRAMGFTVEHWTELADALQRHVADYEVVSSEPSPFGMRYRVDGPLATPSGRTPMVRSVWFIDTGESTPRLVTAHPALSRGPRPPR